MKFHSTSVEGAWLIDLESRADDRGSFGRAFCTEEFKAQGIEMPVVQANLANTVKRGTMRGLHYQVAPAAEAKLMRCVRGSVFDVLVDVRENSPTYLKWFGVELSADNQQALYVPPLCAHGYLTLEDNTDMFYLVSEAYTPGAERGACWDDPAFAIDWPITPVVLSEKDRQWAPFTPVSG
ncbi:MAG: dTDP-4-dehydrorhamnose 3,5-epimerase [Burkholderiaceae bacterium]